MIVVSDEQPTRRYETVDLYRDGAAAKVVLNRPARMNAWSVGLSDDLLTVLRELAHDKSVRAVLLTGAGKAFCTGADLKDAGDTALAGKLDTDTVLRRWYHPIVTTIRQMEKPVVTAVNGPAAGAGVSLALAGDLVVAAESAYFMLSFVGIGLVPDGGSSLFVPSRVGFTRAMEMAMLGERVPAPKAADWGLINYAWPDEEFAKKSDDLLRRLAEGPTRSYAGSKRELNSWLYDRMAAHLDLEATIQHDLSSSADLIEGVTAFMEKRPPKFTGE